MALLPFLTFDCFTSQYCLLKQLDVATSSFGRPFVASFKVAATSSEVVVASFEFAIGVGLPMAEHHPSFKL